MLESKYSNSHALVIGIDKYQFVSVLGYAVNDAAEVAQVLQQHLGFPAENVHLLIDSAATRSAILDKFLSFACEGTGQNDRMVLFFAGHGHTVRMLKGEVGYLVPADGNPNNLASLIRWDELTRNADLISAKHILFVMDACYGGLAITRAIKPGAMRFQKDMLKRPARQVLTAGKADEVVADLGGPLPNHSVFTGHFIEALQGKAESSPGLLTANGVISYVYQAVAADNASQQTPHFGYLSGDGDMILKADFLNKKIEDENEEKEEDILISVPSVLMPDQSLAKSNAELLKEMLSEERFRLRLHDYVAQEVRETLSQTAEDYFPVNQGWANDAFIDRIQRYERTTNRLIEAAVLIGYWGEPYQRATLTLGVKRLSGRLERKSGTTGWLTLRWYPVTLLLYAGGIAAVAGKKYGNLYDLLYAPVPTQFSHLNKTPLVMGAVTGEMGELNEVFKILPGHERNRVPRSEYLYKLLQPAIDDLLFLGPEYEEWFDRFELLYALEYAHRYHSDPDEGIWPPLGRFAWKAYGVGAGNPFKVLLTEAEKYGSAWAPIQAGFFDGSIQAFKAVTDRMNKLFMNLHWY